MEEASRGEAGVAKCKDINHIKHYVSPGEGPIHPSVSCFVLVSNMYFFQLLLIDFSLSVWCDFWDYISFVFLLQLFLI